MRQAHATRHGRCRRSLGTPRRATIRTTGGQPTQELKSSAELPSGRGHHFQLRRGRCRATAEHSCRAPLCLLVAVARLVWAVVLLALVFLAGLWVSGCLVSLCEGADPRAGARGLASRKARRLVSRRSCMVQNSFSDGAAIPCQVVTDCDPSRCRSSRRVTYTPREGSSHPPKHRAPSPRTGVKCRCSALRPEATSRRPSGSVRRDGQDCTSLLSDLSAATVPA